LCIIETESQLRGALERRILCQEETEQDRQAKAPEPAEEWGPAEKVLRKEPGKAKVEERVQALVAVEGTGSVAEFKIEVI